MRYTHVPDYQEDISFYIDWDRTEVFSLSGLGQGECGAGVLDMIEADLTDAEIALKQAEKQEYPISLIKRGLLLAARALLVVRGVDPRTEEEIFFEFENKFVKENLVDSKYSQLKDKFKNIQEGLSFKERESYFFFTQELCKDVRKLYQNMDSSFNFPKLAEKKDIPSSSKSYLLDLKGTPCPINYVKAKIFLENLKSGDVLEILLDEGDPINNVPKSLEADGQRILKIEKKDGFYSVIVERV
ncbi:MAG: sulfurtransferase TusA family protein [Candidatus Omnitrophica bacterium]|nr:sulfurtransferase TusA family protein [Candidatus Omnitrophota bacterium]